MSKALLYELGKSISYGRLPLLAKVLWPMLLAASDDQGRGLADTDVVKWHVCPNVNELTPDTINGALQEMMAQGMIILYEENGRNRTLYQIARWWEYQKMQWARPSQYAPPDGWEDRIRCRINNDYVEKNWKGGNDAGSPEQPPEQPPEQATEPTIESESKLIESKPTKADSSTAGTSVPPPPLQPIGKIVKAKPNSLTAGQRGFLDLFGGKRYKTNAQRDAVQAMEQEHGTTKLLEVARWAAERGMSVGQAVGSVRTALPNWGKPKKPKGNTGKRNAPDEWLARRQAVGMGDTP